MNSEDKLIVTGFGDSNANGDYYYQHDLNGYSLWEKGVSYFIAYYSSLMPWSTTASFYILKKTTYSNAVPIITPLYRKEGTALL